MNQQRLQKHTLSIPNLESATSDVCEMILGELKTRGFSENDLFAVHLALEEAFINAVKHGNKMDEHKKIDVEYKVGPEKIEVWVKDEGTGFKPDAIPDPRCGDNIYRTEGRGLLLMRAYMDMVKFNPKGDSVHMVKHRTENCVKNKSPKTEAE